MPTKIEDTNIYQHQGYQQFNLGNYTLGPIFCRENIAKGVSICQKEIKT
jgi:hypothetical protein